MNVRREVYSATFVRAQEFNLHQSVSSDNRHLINDPNGFLNAYYDDEGWWAWAWLKVYDQTHEQQYLDAAMSIFKDQTQGFYAQCGVLLWSKDYKYDSAISNELFLFVGASLANRVPASSKQFYLNWALKEWEGLHQSGLINSHHTINNNLNLTSCRSGGATVWTYNQGVVLGGLVELSKAMSNASYIAIAKEIARGTIRQMTTASGILRESCDPHCGGNGQQFKGVFMRGLQILQIASP